MTNFNNTAGLDQTLSIVLEVAEEQEQRQHVAQYPDNFVVLHCGVVLEITGITPETYNSVIDKYLALEPQPPIVKIVSKGRDEPNPNDPKYVKDYKQWAGKRTLAIMDALYAMGVQVHSIPDDVPGPDSDDWIEEFRLSGTGKTYSKKERFVFWLRSKVVSKNSTIGGRERNDILLAAIRVMGVAEVDVQEAVKRP